MFALRGSPLRYVALGDSTGLGIGANRDGGYVRRLAKKLGRHGQVELRNYCESGATASDVLDAQVSLLPEWPPHLITLGIGINDVVRELPEEVFAMHLEEIASQLRLSGARVVLVNIPDVTLAPIAAHFRTEPYDRRIEAFNEHIEATAARHDFRLVDLYSASRASLPTHHELFSPDGFHPSAKGYDVWAHAMWPSVSAAVQD